MYQYNVIQGSKRSVVYDWPIGVHGPDLRCYCPAHRVPMQQYVYHIKLVFILINFFIYI
jgi:hypothetical protein